MKCCKRAVAGLLAVLMALSLSGCVNSGNQAVAKLDDDASVNKVITNGKTTKDEVLAQFGQPQEMDFSENGNLKFTYKHVRSTYKASTFIPVVGMFKSGTNDVHKHLVIVFDKDNVVEKHLFTKSKGETVTGLLG